MKTASKLKLFWLLNTMASCDRSEVEKTLRETTQGQDITFERDQLVFNRPADAVMLPKRGRPRQLNEYILLYDDIVGCRVEEHFVELITRKYNIHLLSRRNGSRLIHHYLIVPEPLTRLRSIVRYIGSRLRLCKRAR